MGQRFTELSNKHRLFIDQQKLFFVATAGAQGRVNVSPKGMDSLRVLDNNRVIWLNVTGSGNETSVHVQENARMTIMFCAFEGNPIILRLYGNAKIIHPYDDAWTELSKQLPNIPGARQIFDLSINLVQSSCGMSVPYFDFVDDRELLKDWASKKDEDVLKDYWEEKNQISIDGHPTNILNKSV